MTAVAKHTINVCEFRLDILTHRLEGFGKIVQLSPLASRFLQELAARPGAVVERGELIDILWRGDYLTGDPALNRVVSETRRAVGDDARNPALIQTVHRQGYRLVGPAGDVEDLRVWRAPASHKALMINGALWLVALILIVVGVKVWMDTMIGVLWVAKHTS